MSKNNIYYELCNLTTMPLYPHFFDKLERIQKLVKKINPRKKKHHNMNSLQPDPQIDSDFSQIVRETKKEIILSQDVECDKCKNRKFYQLGNIIWSNNIQHKIKIHQSYPSEYFIKIIMNCYIIDDNIINPPLQLNRNQISKFTYVPLRYNLLLIIDALFKQGSSPRYLGNNNKFIYSEHSGVLSMKNKSIADIIISAETNRLDPGDDNIYLPINTEILAKYEYLFHTHPNTLTYAGRINEGIIYEFPSANDVLNFVKYHNEGIAQASLIIAPEGTYIIRPIRYQKMYNINPKVFYHLRKLIFKLEKLAIKKIKVPVKDLSNPNIFHDYVGSNFTYIKMYNKFIEPYNLFIEYYPREEKNKEWYLRQINLPLIQDY